MKALNEYISESYHPIEYSTTEYSNRIKHCSDIDDIKKVVDDAMNVREWKRYKVFNLYVSRKGAKLDDSQVDVCIVPISFGHPKPLNLNAFYRMTIYRGENPVNELIEKDIEKYCL